MTAILVSPLSQIAREFTPFVASQAVMCANRMACTKIVSLDVDPDHMKVVNPKIQLSTSFVEREMRRRLWWANYVYEINLSIFRLADPNGETYHVLPQARPLPSKTSQTTPYTFLAQAETTLPKLSATEAEFQRAFWMDDYSTSNPSTGPTLPPFSSLGFVVNNGGQRATVDPPTSYTYSHVGWVQPHGNANYHFNNVQSAGRPMSPTSTSLRHVYPSRVDQSRPVNYSSDRVPATTVPGSLTETNMLPPLNMHPYHYSRVSSPTEGSWPDGYLSMIQLYIFFHHGLDIITEKQRLRPKMPNGKVVNGEEAVERALMANLLEEKQENVLWNVRRYACLLRTLYDSTSYF